MANNSASDMGYEYILELKRLINQKDKRMDYYKTQMNEQVDALVSILFEYPNIRLSFYSNIRISFY